MCCYIHASTTIPYFRGSITDEKFWVKYYEMSCVSLNVNYQGCLLRRRRRGRYIFAVFLYSCLELEGGYNVKQHRGYMWIQAHILPNHVILCVLLCVYWFLFFSKLFLGDQQILLLHKMKHTRLTSMDIYFTSVLLHLCRCGSQKGQNTPHSMNSNKIIQLGLSPLKPLDEMFDDCIKSFQDKGFL